MCVVNRLLGKLIVVTCLFCSIFTAPAVAFEPMLPRVYSDNIDVTGWLMSEKLDGVRAYWDGQNLYSKNGVRLSPPHEFVKDLPSFAIEGELWGGRGTFEQTLSVIQRNHPDSDWLMLKFAIFDVPAAEGGFNQRIAVAQQWFDENPSIYAFVIDQVKVDGPQQIQRELARIEGLGGEGLIVRKANALYVSGRNRTILKVKSYNDAEATVVAHLAGKGRNANRMGALLVKLHNGVRFRLGSGFSDAQRDDPPKIGAVITFKYYGYYKSGVPKFPSFLRIRNENTL